MKKITYLFVLLVSGATFALQATTYPQFDEEFTVTGTEKTYTVPLDRSAIWNYSKSSAPRYYSGRISLSRSSVGSPVPGRDFSFGLRSSSLDDGEVAVGGMDEKFARKLPWQLKMSNKSSGTVEVKLFLGGSAITEAEGEANYTQEISRTELAASLDEFFVFVRSAAGATATVSVDKISTSPGWIGPAVARSSVGAKKPDSEHSSKQGISSVVGVVGLGILLLLFLRRSEI